MHRQIPGSANRFQVEVSALATSKCPLMLRKASLLILMGLVTAALITPAAAGRGRQPRKDEIPYRAPTAGIGGVVSQCDEHDQIGCVDFVPRLKERFIQVKVADDSGAAVYANLAQNTDSDPMQEIIHRFCGEMEEPLEIDPTTKVTVHIYEGPGMGALTCVGPATSGIVTAVHSTRP